MKKCLACGFAAVPLAIFGASEVVMYDASSPVEVVATGNVFSVAGSWDISQCGEFEVEVERTGEGAKGNFLEVVMENPVSSPADLNGSGSLGLFKMSIELKEQERSAKRPIPPAMPNLQAIVAKMVRVSASGLFAQMWPSPYWPSAGAGWGDDSRDDASGGGRRAGYQERLAHPRRV